MKKIVFDKTKELKIKTVQLKDVDPKMPLIICAKTDNSLPQIAGFIHFWHLNGWYNVMSNTEQLRQLSVYYHKTREEAFDAVIAIGYSIAVYIGGEFIEVRPNFEDSETIETIEPCRIKTDEQIFVVENSKLVGVVKFAKNEWYFDPFDKKDIKQPQFELSKFTQRYGLLVHLSKNGYEMFIDIEIK